MKPNITLYFIVLKFRKFPFYIVSIIQAISLVSLTKLDRKLTNLVADFKNRFIIKDFQETYLIGCADYAATILFAFISFSIFANRCI